MPGTTRPCIGSRAPGVPGSEVEDAAGFPPEYRRAFSLLAFAMGRFVVDHVLRSARLFDDDTEALVLFGMLAQLNIVHLVPPGSSPATTLDHLGRVPDIQHRLRPVRVRDLAQITGRPRETVRRKLEHMQAAGRVRRVPAGWVYEASSVDAEFQALTIEGMRRFLQTADMMRSVLQGAAAAIREEGVTRASPADTGEQAVTARRRRA